MRKVGIPLVVTFDMGNSHFAVVSVPLDDGSLTAVLTAAEREVAALVCAGLGNAAIAKCRGTSERTVANQIASILRKLKVGSRFEMAALLALCRLGDDEPRHAPEQKLVAFG